MLTIHEAVSVSIMWPVCSLTRLTHFLFLSQSDLLTAGTGSSSISAAEYQNRFLSEPQSGSKEEGEHGSETICGKKRGKVLVGLLIGFGPETAEEGDFSASSARTEPDIFWKPEPEPSVLDLHSPARTSSSSRTQQVLTGPLTGNQHQPEPTGPPDPLLPLLVCSDPDSCKRPRAAKSFYQVQGTQSSIAQ